MELEKQCWGAYNSIQLEFFEPKTKVDTIENGNENEGFNDKTILGEDDIEFIRSKLLK